MNIRTLAIAITLAVGLYSCGDAGQEEVVTEVTEETPEVVEEVAVENSESYLASTSDIEDSIRNAHQEYTIDVANSTISWKGTMVGVYSHEGEIKITKGYITTNNGEIGIGSFIIDAASILTTDDDALYATASREDLVGHLKSDDFLGVQEFPTASLDIIGHVSGEGIAKASLTIKGIQEPVDITDVVFTEADGTITVSGKLTFDRQKYGISFEKGGEMVISDDIELTISITGSAN